jgi:hypothetical protein
MFLTKLLKKLQLQGRRDRGDRSVPGLYVRISEGPSLYRESGIPLIFDSR